MHALELRNDALQWETERQNRLLQSATEQKKKQARLEAVPQEQAPAAGVQLNEWVDKVSVIPDIRSALIPLDNPEGWSKPFSLAKADMEPWFSYFKGYRQSRLFLSQAVHDIDNPDAASIDYPVRALLELKSADARLITEPPVQINGQVEYFDTDSALNAGYDASQFRALLRSAVLTHDKQLKRAEEKGREMGDALYDALMGEGHANLIGAWERVFHRKPTIDELHQMLTSGRIRVSAEKKAAAVSARKPALEMPPAAPVMRPAPERRPAIPTVEAPPPPPVMVTPAAEDDDDDEPFVSLSRRKKKLTLPRKLVWSVANAAAGFVAVAAYIYFF
ncbi:hypothetical protein [Noviherbaspirillum denitrificans]|uniref:Transmembrane protein n=1 Tax=Noviherbaspirillum denitrificans TaxID=1968433 RepID=A0A254THQ5_9BURK|nr:hypothetical protein [Noviherbaspirillum denitrificans]OWW22134.1 hypothetical protein AYR66_24190 [Noviherbaspirillum denitrificans]